KLFSSLKNENITDLLTILETVMEKTVDVSRFVMNLVSGLKDSLVYSYTKNDNYINTNDKELIEYVESAYVNTEIVEMINLLLDYHEKIRFSATPFVHFEIAMIELYEKTPKETKSQTEVTVDEPAFEEEDEYMDEQEVEELVEIPLDDISLETDELETIEEVE